jgi:phosphosulfolactate synthase
MVIDKGLGLHAFYDLLEQSAPYMRWIKLGFGSGVLYPPHVLTRKIAFAQEAGVHVMFGGTLFEIAVMHGQSDHFFKKITDLGIRCMEISDGTVPLSREMRSACIARARREGLEVLTEYGSKTSANAIDPQALAKTVREDLACGASFVILEARESGRSGIFDEDGMCRTEDIQTIVAVLDDPTKILWEAPLPAQHVALLRILGPHVALGNVNPADVLSLESLRRGLRADTLLCTTHSPTLAIASV